MENKDIFSQARTGLFEEDIEVYHGTKAISSTLLRLFMKSPKKFSHAWEGKQERVETEAFRVGSALHCMVLEPKEYPKRFVVAPEINRRTKAGRDEWEMFLVNHEGKEVLKYEQYEQVLSMAEAISKDGLASGLLEDTKREMSARVTLTNGLVIQCRPDAMKAGHLLDVKTCVDVGKFKWEMKSYGYHLQAAFYYFLMSRLFPEDYGEANFYFLAVEKSSPWEVKVYGLGYDNLQMIVEQYIEPAFHNLKDYLYERDINEAGEIEWLDIL